MSRSSLFLVDDDPMILRSWARFFRMTFDVTTAEVATDLLEALRAGKDFDVILSDLDMPVMSGMGLYRALEAEFPRVLPHVLFWSADASREAVAFFDGRAQLLSKTMDISVLLDKVKGVLSVPT